VKVRYFIVSPVFCMFPVDLLFTVCLTTKRCSYDEIYMNDWFVDEESCGSLVEAIAVTKTKFGCKRPFVLGCKSLVEAMETY